MYQLLIGIDPGWSGGVAWRFPQKKMVVAQAFKNLTEKDISETFKLIRVGIPDAEIFAYLELVHSMPKQGVASSFKFGENYGILKGILHTHNIPFDYVTPQKWQKALGCLSHGDKNVTKDKAQRFFPGHHITHAIADAMLIMEYCTRITSGTL